ncbi:drug resistance transporter EmrB/QacA subfamily [Clostridium sp. D5]|uniref:drug resistance transporter EmrB/QacA subfamily n=1 Tax=Clostridium sp. D5 TaxID=556261 RepID=UPI0001FC7D41|nr:drug resistance transporter EmrB/QacA subfamily [Clostridium sp. D5]EGB92258.1 drug resistance transporter, EmrB/QacA subfamily [Clostridium sp. D5]
MPGTHIKQELTAHGTALLTSLRTIAGAIGSAVFVGIMNTVGKNTVSTYGEQAPMFGVKIAFLCMGGSTLILLSLAVFGIKGKGKK